MYVSDMPACAKPANKIAVGQKPVNFATAPKSQCLPALRSGCGCFSRFSRCPCSRQFVWHVRGCVGWREWEERRRAGGLFVITYQTIVRRSKYSTLLSKLSTIKRYQATFSVCLYVNKQNVRPRKASKTSCPHWSFCMPRVWLETEWRYIAHFRDTWMSIFELKKVHFMTVNLV